MEFIYTLFRGCLPTEYRGHCRKCARCFK